MERMTTAQAATRLGVSPRRVRVLAKNGRIEGEKLGRDWILDAVSVDAYAISERKAGRPRREHG